MNLSLSRRQNCSCLRASPPKNPALNIFFGGFLFWLQKKRSGAKISDNWLVSGNSLSRRTVQFQNPISIDAHDCTCVSLINSIIFTIQHPLWNDLSEHVRHIGFIRKNAIVGRRYLECASIFKVRKGWKKVRLSIASKIGKYTFLFKCSETELNIPEIKQFPPKKIKFCRTVYLILGEDESMPF